VGVRNRRKIIHPHPSPLPSRERVSLLIPSPLGGEGEDEGA